VSHNLCDKAKIHIKMQGCCVDLICLQMYSTDFIPACHNIIYKLLKIFVISRIHFVLKTNCDNIIKAIPSSSRSVAMKKSVINYKCYGKNKTICDKNK
jgi:hypothetical protein